jgi:hypothetical protein
VDQDADGGGCANTQECAPGMVCVANQCVVDMDAGEAGACLAGWADCDTNQANGCEAYLFGDSNNCGSCGVVCGGATSCEAGTCMVFDAAPPANCDPFTNAGCQSGWACVISIPYYGPTDIYCKPAGNVPADSPCSPQALCQPGTECVLENTNFTGHCRQFCDLGGGTHTCPIGDTCGNIFHPSIGICVP